MTPTHTANRIVNAGIAVMVFACASLWAVDTYLHTPKQTQRTRTVVITPAKSEKSFIAESQKGGRSENSSAGKGATQQNDKAISRAKTSQPVRQKSWYEEASLSDPDFPRLEMYIAKGFIDSYYADVYKVLELDNATCESLRDLLAAKRTALNKAVSENYETRDTSGYDSAKNVATRINLEYDEQIFAILGQEKFDLLREFETTLPERTQINRFRAELEFSGEPLTLDQELALLPVIENYVSNDPRLSRMTKSLLQTSPLSAVHMLRFSEEDLTIFEGVLSPGQIETLAGFRKRQDNRRSINYGWSTMGAQMRRQGKQ
jgi:hypothetical protein